MRNGMLVRALPLMALFGLLAAAPATAQEGSLEIGLGGGLIDLDEKLGGDSGLALDLRAGYFVTDRFEMEIQSVHASSILEGSFRAHTLNALYHFSDRKGLVPYVLIGAGTADVELDCFFCPPVEDEGTALRAAAGGRFWLGERQRAAVRTELSALNEDAYGDNATHVGCTVVFSWRFGDRGSG